MYRWSVAGSAAIAAAVVVLTGVGCNETEGSGDGFAEVAPILQERCTSCHQEGGAGPFALETHADAAQWADAIKLAVQERTMPPWLVTDDGSCGTFEDSQGLSDEEIETIVDWVDAGAPDGSDGLQLTPEAPPRLDRVDWEIATPEIVPVAEGDIFAPNDEYRCFVVENDRTEDVYLTGYDILPGNDAIVHHVLGMPVKLSRKSYGSGTNAEEIARMDGADGRPGWDCIGTAGGAIREDGIPITWGPGQGAVEYGEGLGIKLTPDHVLVFQLHYNLVDPANVGSSDSTRIDIALADTVEREMHMSLPDPFLESIFDFPNYESLPPGEAAFEYVWELPASQLPAYAYWNNAPDTFYIHGIAPHMHDLGSKIRMEILREGGAEECAVDIPSWDFEWQLLYRYKEPVALGPGDRVRVTCTYDTSDVAGETIPGWGTENEMCLMVLMISE